MCIIVCKNRGVNFPSKDTIKTCFINNDDGAGYMLATGDKVIIKKGFMDFKTFWASLSKTRKKYGDNLSYVMHFRITTQAGKRKDCTHPYALSKNMKDLRKLDTTASIGVAHNGVIDLTSEWRKDIDYNDTMKFITDYLSYIINDFNDLNNTDTCALINRLTRSRLAILNKDGDLKMLGDGWTEADGVYYSNTSYRSIKTAYTLPTSYAYYWGSYYDDYDDYYKAPARTSTEASKADDFNEWDYYKDNNGVYDFFIEYCPMSEAGNASYCDKCANKKICYTGGDKMH